MRDELFEIAKEWVELVNLKKLYDANQKDREAEEEARVNSVPHGIPVGETFFSFSVEDIEINEFIAISQTAFVRKNSFYHPLVRHYSGDFKAALSPGDAFSDALRDEESVELLRHGYRWHQEHIEMAERAANVVGISLTSDKKS